MKHVVSVSIGSSSRDHSVDLDILGEQVRIERRGTDGNINKAREMIQALDGQVDAIGLGGLDLYIFAGGRRYTFREALKLAHAAKHTPVVDGSGLKNSLERWVVEYLVNEADLPLSGMKVLLVSAVDRFGMAESMVAHGCQVTFGDLIFALGVPVPIRSLKTLSHAARVLAPIVTKLPFKWIYPTGSKQEQVVEKWGRFFDAADIVAGDFHMIRRHMPKQLKGKGIITNTVTAKDMELLETRGAGFVVTTTPSLGGRSFGTNVIEATLIAISGRRPEELRDSDYMHLLDQVKFRPRIERRNGSLTTARTD